MKIIKNLVRADQEGDFLLHMDALQKLYPTFMGCGSLYYQSFATFYLEQLNNLRFTMPELYSFLK